MQQKVFSSDGSFALYPLCILRYTRRRRRGRVVEGAPLLREYTGNGIEGSNPFVSAIFAAFKAANTK